MKLFVQNDNATIRLEVAASKHIDDIKADLCSVTGLWPGQQALLYEDNGQWIELTEGDEYQFTLDHYPMIQDEAILLLQKCEPRGMQIAVTTPSAVFYLVVEESDTIGFVKKQMMLKEGTQVANQRLNLEDHELPDEASIRDLRLTDKCELTLEVAPSLGEVPEMQWWFKKYDVWGLKSMLQKSHDYNNDDDNDDSEVSKAGTNQANQESEQIN